MGEMCTRTFKCIQIINLRNMSISVCIATYNGEKYIKNQLISILLQLSSDDEIIISDNGSEDKTIDIINSFNDKRIKIYNFPTPKNAILNIENALKKANKDYIFLSDQDDIWLSGKVNKMLVEFNTRRHLVMSEAAVVNSDLSIIYHSMSEWRKYRSGFLRNLFCSRYLGCCMAFDRYFLNQIIPFPKSIKAHDVWIGLYGEISRCIKFINEPLILYRRHEANFSSASSKSTNSIFFMFKYRFYFLFTITKRYIFIKKKHS